MVGLNALSKFVFVFAQTKNQKYEGCGFSSWKVSSQGVWGAEDLVVLVGPQGGRGAACWAAQL